MTSRIKAPKPQFEGRIGWAVGLPNKPPRLAGGTHASLAGGDDDEESKNLIVNVGLNAMGTVSAGGLSSRCYVGTGTAETVPVDTMLGAEYDSGNGGLNYAAAVNSSTQSALAAPWWHESTRVYQFPADGVDGAALSEIGFFDTTVAAKAMFSRVLFRDGGGAPTTLTVLAGEQLTIYYTIRNTVPTGDTFGTMDIAGTTYNYTMRPANADTLNQWNPAGLGFGPSGADVRFYESAVLGPEDGQMTGTSASLTDSYSAYVDSSYERGVNASASTSQANGAFNGIQVNSMWQLLLDAPFTKTSDDTLAFNDFMTLKWAEGDGS